MKIMQRLYVFSMLVFVSLRWAQAKDMTNLVVTLNVRTHPTLGDYLTDGDGKTLYIFLDDIDGTSHCYDTCTTLWLPLLTREVPRAASGLNQTILAVTSREDRLSQVTYNGYPLYYFVGDTKPGDMYGQNWQDRWYVLSPQGYRLAQEVEGRQ
jgi:predicted lipoprotein with Yx(FWY)xxD motif